ncbi:CocE/NonD family hydrolase [Streptomyces geranii]|uniref:CocE/NonD family hydrolase n=1 Tax=Streptomyces geranii TaxID=2058923 RepID=UPI000D027D35|nr:CocE/NonD family hydrolase [Streptomyces geranii]
MSLASHALQRLLHLSPPRTRRLTVERDRPVTMRDGTVLLADRWIPSLGGDGLPTALLRSPYGRTGMIATQLARPLAERGYQVVVQSTRGTFGSGGDFDPLRREREDGLDTLDWLLARSWCGEGVVLFGGSYLGFVQWAVADAVPDRVRAILPSLSESAFTLEQLRTDGFSLEAPFGWGVQVAGQERQSSRLGQFLGAGKVRRAMTTLPLTDADSAVLGHPSPYFQNVLAHDADAPFWQPADHRARVSDITVPVSTVGGWYDIFLPGQLRDFQELQKAGRRTARLTVGPWSHISMGASAAATAEALDFALPLARGEQPEEKAAVRLYVMGEERWRDFASWPPPGYEPKRLRLHPGGVLSAEPPVSSAADGYTYDPADPTPAVGGVRMAVGVRAGRVDNRQLEAREDVLTYTTEALEQDAEVIGEVSAEIWFSSSLPYSDVFVRLCDVDEKGRSTNVCDGLVSLTGADTLSRAEVRLWPTAYRFRRGHRIRVQVSSGAFPRYNRNPGSGEPRATATALVPADQLVFHDPDHPSAVVLPVRRGD